MFIIIVFWLGSDWPSSHLLPSFTYFPTHALFLPSSFISLSYFIIAVAMRERLGKYSCMSSPFLKAILNATLFFRETRWSFKSKCCLSKINCSNYYYSCQYKYNLTINCVLLLLIFLFVYFFYYWGTTPGGSEWILRVGDYVDNSFAALGSSHPREVRLEL